jgi:hypothetical protein
MSDYPHFTVHWKSGEGRLLSPCSYETPIEGHRAITKFIQLREGGLLALSVGYVWDFGSGPAIDTPDMVYASLAHDALYELMVLGKLPWEMRRAVDQYFRDLLKAAGMGWLRRQWVYLGVRIGYPVWKALGR